MPEHDAYINNYQHLAKFPRAEDALHNLRKIASLVKPIMRKRGWHVGTLTEFWPPQQNLLGLNENRGQRICLRLRYPGDKTCFLPMEEVVDTMLHELSHNVHGAHDSKFHALWNELRDEYMDLKLKGYSGEGFLSEGRRLGGRGQVPIEDMRRQARQGAELRRSRQAGSGQKLGGASVLQGTDMRTVIADAASRRKRITQGCASGSANADQVAKEAASHGFKTKADEDHANDVAISQALWELIQEEEDRKAGVEPDLWIRSDSSRPTGLTWDPKTGLNQTFEGNKTPPNVTAGPSRSAFPQPKPPVPTHSKPTPPSNYANRDWNVLKPRSRSRLLSEDEENRRAQRLKRSGPVDLTNSSDSDDTLPGTTPQFEDTNLKKDTRRDVPTWACETCTLVNPADFLACDACGMERPLAMTATLGRGRDQTSRVAGATRSTVVSPPNPTKTEGRKPESLGWNCRRCGSFMETQWWTCSACGLMKEAS